MRKMEKNNSEEINFQHYVDAAKQNKIDWNIFIDLMQDLSYSDIDRLRNLNAILLTELTMNQSNMDKFKYLNGLLLTEFKKYIQRNQINIDMTSRNEDSENHVEANIYESLDDNESQNQNQDFNYIDSNVYENLDDNETKDNITSLCKEEIIESNTNIFLCHICNKEYNINFHLNQHIKNVHEKENSNALHFNTIQNDQKIDENQMTAKSIPNAINSKIPTHSYKHENQVPKNEYSKARNLKTDIHSVHEGHKYHKCKFCVKLFDKAGHLKTHIHTVHEGHKNYKCDSCGKFFTALQGLERHLHNVHDGYKDYNCETCSKSFSLAGVLKRHIQTVHEGHRNHICQSCFKTFSEASTLKNHIYTVHDGHKDNKCESCGNSFSTRQNLKTHIKTIHEGQKDHKCEYCAKSFSHAHTLKNHINKNVCKYV